MHGRRGERRKRFAATNMNVRSSRAHTIVILRLLQRRAGGSRAGWDAEEGDMVESTLHIADLAGSEQVKKSGVRGERLTEAARINNSLLVLGRCVRALARSHTHIPYRSSKLTMLLKSALGGCSRTTAVVTASPAAEHGNETLNALRFGERCALITNTAQLGATSMADAVAAVDAALGRCDRAIGAMEARGRGGSAACVKLRQRATELRARRAEMVAGLE